MKKIVMFVITGIMMMGIASCGGSNTAQIADAEELLVNVWAEYQETAAEDIQFPIGGGNAETMVMDVPAAFDLALASAQDELVYTYCFPLENMEVVDNAATAMNMMMSNNFTTAAYHVVSPEEVQNVVDGIKETTEANQWMCGLPESFIIVTVGDEYVVSAYGNGQVMDAYKAAFDSVYGNLAEVVVEESLAE